jgi:hypothetical protein
LTLKFVLRVLIRTLSRAGLRPTNIEKLRRLYDGIRFRYSFPAQRKLAANPFKVTFLCHAPVQWPKISAVVLELVRRRADLRIAIITSCDKNFFPTEVVSAANVSILTMPLTLAYLTESRVLYTPLPYLPPLQRPRLARVVHSLHSIGSLDGIFTEEDFDAFDYILCAGPHQIDSFLERARRRPALKGKWLVRAGYPKLDLVLASQAGKRRSPRPAGAATVVYAPTHVYGPNQGLGTVVHWGRRIIEALISAGHSVIFRPHPLSLLDQDRSVIKEIVAAFGQNPQLSIDTREDYATSYTLADVMVTDLSGTGFTFSFCYGKPCIFFAPCAEAERDMKGIQFEARERVGGVVRDIDRLAAKVSELRKADMTDSITQFRDETIYNVGNSATYIVSCLEDIVASREGKDWIRL